MHRATLKAISGKLFPSVSQLRNTMPESQILELLLPSYNHDF